MSQPSDSAAPRSARRPFVAGNWKMYTTIPEAKALAREIALGAPSDGPVDIALFPPAVALQAVVAAVAEAGGADRQIVVGAQNMHFEKEGAFTGETSAGMIRSAGATAVILGHSERRHVFGESEDMVGRKVISAIEAGLVPILCVGEKLEEREAGETMGVVRRQLLAGMGKLADATKHLRVIVAYEPVWAIGTGKTATPRQGQEVHAFIRSEIEGLLSTLGASGRSDECRILYGGSVKPENAAELLAEPDIDGLLVGGASLKAGSFLKICAAGR